MLPGVEKSGVAVLVRPAPRVTVAPESNPVPEMVRVAPTEPFAERLEVTPVKMGAGFRTTIDPVALTPPGGGVVAVTV
jgi:hypothetical protein